VYACFAFIYIYANNSTSSVTYVAATFETTISIAAKCIDAIVYACGAFIYKCATNSISSVTCVATTFETTFGVVA